MRAVALTAWLVGITVVADEREVELLAVEVGAGYLHLHLVAESIASVVIAADQAEILLIIFVEVIVEIAHRHEALTHILVELHIETPFGHTGDDTLVDLTEAVFHILHLLVADRGTLGVGGERLHIGAPAM